MIVLTKALPRRTFLRGLGTALALPLLDAMIPSMTALGATAPAPATLRRLTFFYIPVACDGMRAMGTSENSNNSPNGRRRPNARTLPPRCLAWRAWRRRSTSRGSPDC